MRFYTGVGSRDIAYPAVQLLEKIAQRLAKRGFIVRSGGAAGADSAFAAGALEASRIYTPWKSFSSDPAAIVGPSLPTWNQAQAMAQQVHGAWQRLGPGGKAAHSRNVFQVLGERLDQPSEFLICWAPPPIYAGTYVKGGTNTAVALAHAHKIPVFNLWEPGGWSASVLQELQTHILRIS